MTIASRDTGRTRSRHGTAAGCHDAPLAVPSVWAVVSAYLHSGTAASEAAPETIRGSAPERVAQVRGLFEQSHPPAPRPTVQRGSTRDALRSLFTRVEGLDPATLDAPALDTATLETATLETATLETGDEVDEPEVIDLRDHREPAAIDLRDGADQDRGRRVQEYATMRRETVDDAVVRWYTMRHRQHSRSAR